MTALRVYLQLFALVMLLGLASCKVRPRYAVGDHLIPLGSSDPGQIVTVVAVEPESYRVTLGGEVGGKSPIEERARDRIDSDYVRVDLPVGGSWVRHEDIATPTPAPTIESAVSATPAPTVVETPSPTPTATPAGVPADVVNRARSAVVQISTFDKAGRLVKTGAGFFVSEKGIIATSSSAVEGAVNAVAKSDSGKIYNVIGLLASSSDTDLALVKADATKVPFLDPTQLGAREDGSVVAVIESTGRKGGGSAPSPATLAKEGDAATLRLKGENLSASAGCPVIDSTGHLVGIATQQAEPAGALTVIPADALTPLLTAAAANRAPIWPAAGTPSPTATPKPSASPSPSRDAQLIYSPQPRYPTAARFAYRRAEGTGRYAITFGANGVTTSVRTVQSAGSETLDNAALETLRTWRAQPGRPSQRVISIDFRSSR